MNQARVQPGLFIRDNRYILAFGGETLTVERYDILRDVWEEQNVTFPESFHGAYGIKCVCKDPNTILIFGGEQKEVHEYNLQTTTVRPLKHGKKAICLPDYEYGDKIVFDHNHQTSWNLNSSKGYFYNQEIQNKNGEMFIIGKKEVIQYNKRTGVLKYHEGYGISNV